MQHDVDREVGAEDVGADVTGRVGLVQRHRHAFLSDSHLATDVQEALRQPGRVAGDEAALDDLVGIELHQQPVLVGTGFALVTVDHEVARELALRGEPPLDPGRESGTAATEHVGTAHLIVHLRRCQPERSP